MRPINWHRASLDALRKEVRSIRIRRLMGKHRDGPSPSRSDQAEAPPHCDLHKPHSADLQYMQLCRLTQMSALPCSFTFYDHNLREVLDEDTLSEPHVQQNMVAAIFNIIDMMWSRRLDTSSPASLMTGREKPVKSRSRTGIDFEVAS